jgi:hypothetical protein
VGTAALMASVALAGCHSGGSGPAPSSSPTETPTSAPSATTPAGEALRQLATAAAGASYRATYNVRQSHPATRATWRVWRTPSSLRVDVVTRRVTATLIVTAKASYSCRRAKHRKTCFRVAGAAQPVPAPFQLLAQKLFSTDIDSLKTHADAYAVTAAGPDAGTAHIRASTCYRLQPSSAAPKPRVEKATYCFSTSGVLTSVTYPSGNLVRLQHLSMHRPTHSAFVPYSSPTPLPT